MLPKRLMGACYESEKYRVVEGRERRAHVM